MRFSVRLFRLTSYVSRLTFYGSALSFAEHPDRRIVGQRQVTFDQHRVAHDDGDLARWSLSGSTSVSTPLVRPGKM